jgi:hypothetical protein
MDPKARSLLIGIALGYWVVPKLVVMLYDIPFMKRKQ